MTAAEPDCTNRLPCGPGGLLGTPSAAGDDAFCRDVLPRVSRTFALSIALLPPELRAPIRVAYLLCRIVDTLEDAAGIPATLRQRLFDHFESLLNDDGADPQELERRSAALGEHDDALLCRRAGAVFRSFRRLAEHQRAAIRPHVAEMSHGMREYAARSDATGTLHLHDVADLERYCYFVAGTVGQLLTTLFVQHVGAVPAGLKAFLEERAVRFGLGLQLVNIVKDVAQDARRGACYVPTSILADHGLTSRDLLDPEHRQQALDAVASLCALARGHLAAAVEYTLALPTEGGHAVRRFCAVPVALALATLEEVSHGEDTLRPGRTPKVGRLTVATLVAQSQAAVRSNSALRSFFDVATTPA